jgi:NhaA family Na+:H+ antiporter
MTPPSGPPFPETASGNRRPPASVLRNLLRGEAGGGIVLMAAAAVALVLANSALAPLYFGLLKTYVGA